MRTILRKLFLALLMVACGSVSLAAAEVVIKGTVTDSAGKPVRGATVKATMGYKSVTRFTQPNGQYEITVPSGKYDVTAYGFGFTTKRVSKDTSETGDTNFSLTPKWDVTRLSGAEVEQLIPDDAGGKFIKAACTECHDFAVVMHRRGMSPEEWKSFIPTMTNGRRDQPQFTPNQLTVLSQALGKYFGPDSKYFGPDADPPNVAQIKHPEVADAVLKSTIYEWTTPTGIDGFPHSIDVDSKRGIAWFSEVGNRGLDPAKCALFTPSTPAAAGANCGDNKIGRFDIKSEKFSEFLAPHPHTGAVGVDGRVWYAEAMRNTTSPNLAVIDPNTNKITYYKDPDANFHAHTPVVDKKTGNVWLSGGRGEFVEFDIETLKFKHFKFALPAKYPENATGLWEGAPGDPEPTPKGSTYHLGVDSKGGIWAAVSDMGLLVRLDPNTGETKEYFPPVHKSRGILVDQNDNVWFAAYGDHKLGKLDPKTGAFRLYQPPTVGASPYGITEETKTGRIWYGDQTGDNITEFDPKTEKFTEYPLPNATHPSTPRFIWAAPDGKVWFTEYWIGRIGYIDPGPESKQVAAR